MFFHHAPPACDCECGDLDPEHWILQSIRETAENNFLDLVDGEGNVLVQGQGAADVNRIARSQGLTLPALGYWSPEGHCFVEPAPGDCNGVFNR